MANSSDTPHYEQDMPFEVPEGWEWVTIGKLCSFLSRGKSPKYSEERKYPVFAQKCNLYDGDISLEQARFLDPETISKWSDEYKLIDGDILVNSTGTGTVGRIRLFHSDILGDYPFVVPDSHVSVVRTLEEIESKFVLAFLSSDYGQTYIEDNLAGSTNQKELYIGILENMQFPLPPHEEQLRIVTAVDKWFALIDTIDQGKVDLQTAIKQTKSKILDLAIHGKLVPQDPSDEPASELLKRINPKAQITCDNEHSRKLPYNWCLCNLGDVCMLENGFAFSSDQYKAKGIPLIRISNIKDNEISLSSCVFINEGYEEKYIVHSGDLLIAMSGATTGKMGIYNQKYVAYLNQRVGNIKIVDSNLLFDKYRNYFLFSQKNKILELAYGGAQPNISGKVINSLFVPLPPIAEQKRIVQKIEVLFSIIDTVEQALQA